MNHDKNHPRILLLTDDCVCEAHGTGAVLMRHLDRYPAENIFHAFYTRVAEPCFGPGHELDYKHADEPTMRKAADRLGTAMVDAGFAPDLVYSHFYGVRGLMFLRVLMQRVLPDTPVLQHLHDYRPGGPEDAGRLDGVLRWLAGRGDTIFASTDTIAEEAARVIGEATGDGDIPVVSPFRCTLPARWKTEHRTFAHEPGADGFADFHAVMLGNVWLPPLVEDVQAAWRALGEDGTPVRPIQWHAHPFSQEFVAREGFAPGNGIEYAGFLGHDVFWDTLIHADMAVVPVNRARQPEDDYARYSLPSRITHLAAAGLPMFFGAGPGTDTWRFVHEHGIGVCAVPEDTDAFHAALHDFVHDRALRAQCGKNARALAQDRFGLAAYQDFLYGKFREVAQR